MTSLGKIATPPQATGSCQFTNVRLATEGGAATPAHQMGKLVARTPEMSRTGYPAFDQARGQDIAKNAGLGYTHGICDHEHIFGHRLDGAARRNGYGAGANGGKIFTWGEKTQGGHGRYNSKSEVLREGIRLIQEREARLTVLDQALARGIDDEDAKRTKPLADVVARLERK